MFLSQIKQLKISRILICALRIPFSYLVLRNHISKKNGLTIDKNGHYIPWITYPAIDFLENIDFSGCKVFEYGSGSSSLWWSRRSSHVTSVEMDESWFKKMIGILPDNARLIQVSDGGLYPIAINNFEEKFDVIVIDGAERFKCSMAAINKISDNGLIILDNTDWYPNAARQLRDDGFIQIDFYGYSPNNSFNSITSIFFKSTKLIGKRYRETKKVIGGNIITEGVLDDG